MWWKKETKDGGGNNAVEGDVTEDNKGRGGDGMEAEAGERAAQSHDKKAKTKGKEKKSTMKAVLGQIETAAGAGFCGG